MLRHSTLNFCKRFYSDSTFSQRTPVIRVASSRIGRVLKKRSNAESDYRPAPNIDPARKLEPFPFKVTEENKVETLRRAVMPLHDLPYDEQLNAKQSICRNALRDVAQELYRNGTPVRLDVSRLPCHVNPIVKAADLYNYRNKDELSIWRGLDGKTPTVGYMLFPISKHGDTVCVEPHGCTIMKEETLRLTDVLQDFIRNQAKLPVSYDLGSDGGWRRFMIRSNLERELMLIGHLNPRALKVQQVIDEKKNFRDFFVEKANAANLNLKSLYFQPCPNNSCSHLQVPFELLYGEKSLKETINGSTFLISPESHIHHNTSGLEILLKTVRKTAIDCFQLDPQAKQKPLLLDVSCGVGTMGINMADLVSGVVGIDKSSLAIDDARANAKLNNLKKSEYICSELEIVIERVLEKYSAFKNDTIAICVAPNAGFHRNITNALRRCKDVKKIIYVTPRVDSDGFMKNMLTLCKKEIGKVAPPFTPVVATPVDVYPQLRPCDLVLALERLPE